MHYRPWCGSFGAAIAQGSCTLVAQAGLDAGIRERLALRKPVVAVKGIRTLRKSDMVLNGLTPRMEVDPETYAVKADGELLTCEPASVLPMAQRYFLF